jgi:hypothetical protein
MQTVYKYGIPLEDYFDLELPKNAQILTVQVQYEEPYIWALVNNELSTEKRKFRLAGTGHPIRDKELKYIGSFQLENGRFVGHLFEVVQNTLLIEGISFNIKS